MPVSAEVVIIDVETNMTAARFRADCSMMPERPANPKVGDFVGSGEIVTWAGDAWVRVVEMTSEIDSGSAYDVHSAAGEVVKSWRTQPDQVTLTAMVVDGFEHPWKDQKPVSKWNDLADGTGHAAARYGAWGWRCPRCGAESMDKELFAGVPCG